MSALPRLAFRDFGPGLEHVAETYQQDRILAMLHRDDAARGILPQLPLAPGDPYRYVFVHGGYEESRFENRDVGTHEIPVGVVAAWLQAIFGGQLNGQSLRLCTCYGNLLRPGDIRSVAGVLAGMIPRASIDAYHGLVILDTQPPGIRLGRAVRWDPTGFPPGPVVVGPPVPWERVLP